MGFFIYLLCIIKEVLRSLLRRFKIELERKNMDIGSLVQKERSMQEEDSRHFLSVGLFWFFSCCGGAFSVLGIFGHPIIQGHVLSL